MTPKMLKTATEEAERFLRAASIALAGYGKNEYGNMDFAKTAHTAAVKRASMDLSKALSVLRRRPS